MERGVLIIDVIKECITKHYPMVKGVSIRVGKELNRNYEYHLYYRIIIDYSPDDYCKETCNVIREDIYNFRGYLFIKGESLLSVDFNSINPHAFGA
jgi:hypothetical protein